MGLNLKKPWNIVILVVFNITIILSALSSVYAITYQFSDNFNDQDISDWSTWLDDWCGDQICGTGVAEWDTNNGYLESSGELIINDWNIAQHSIPHSLGAWSLDVSYTDDARASPNGYWMLLLSDLGSTKHLSEDVTTGLRFEFHGSYIGLYFHGITHNFMTFVVPSELQIFDTWQHLNIIVSEKDVSVYLEEQLLDTKDLSFYEFELSELTILSHIGSHVKFDNVQTTSDFEGVLSMLESSIKKSDIEVAPYIIVASLITLGTTATLWTRHIIKKKI